MCVWCFRAVQYSLSSLNWSLGVNQLHHRNKTTEIERDGAWIWLCESVCVWVCEYVCVLKMSVAAATSTYLKCLHMCVYIHVWSGSQESVTLRGVCVHMCMYVCVEGQCVCWDHGCIPAAAFSFIQNHQHIHTCTRAHTHTPVFSYLSFSPAHTEDLPSDNKILCCHDNRNAPY